MKITLIGKVDEEVRKERAEELTLAHDAVADHPQIVEKQMVDRFRDQREAVDEQDLLERPALQTRDLTEDDADEQDLDRLGEQQTDRPEQEIAFVLHQPLEILGDEDAVETEISSHTLSLPVSTDA